MVYIRVALVSENHLFRGLGQSSQRWTISNILDFGGVEKAEDVADEDLGERW